MSPMIIIAVMLRVRGLRLLLEVCFSRREVGIVGCFFWGLRAGLLWCSWLWLGVGEVSGVEWSDGE